MLDVFKQSLIRALAIDVPHEARSANEAGRPAAVLILIAAQVDGSPAVLLTRRTDQVETHKGQIAFPGGMTDAEDLLEVGAITTALRETEEEVGVARHQTEVLGELPKLSTGTGFCVTPVVGVLRQPISEVKLRLSQHEIAEAFWVPFERLQDSAIYRREFFEVGAGVRYQTHVYQHGPYRIWGATAAVIKNLLDRLAKV